jgi:hypothetical protein
MHSRLVSITKNPVFVRISVLLFSSLIILTSAASCSIPGFTPAGNQQNRTLGILKFDPNFRYDDGSKLTNFAKLNAVKQLDGNINTDGLTNVSPIKMAQIGKEDFYLLTRSRGLLKSDTTNQINGQTLSQNVQIWERKYIFPVPKNGSNDEVNAAISRNNSFESASMSFLASQPDTIYITGKINQIGKIYKSTDGGDTFREVYTEVQQGVSVVASTIDPNNPNRVFAFLQGGTLIRSLDAGLSWQKLRNFQDTVTSLDFVPEFDNQLVAVFKSKGVYIGKNDGDVWDAVATSRKITQDANAPKDISLNQNAFNTQRFGVFEKLIPVTATKNQWLLIADRQMWYSEGLDKPFTRLELPLKNDQFNISDIQADPVKGLDRILVSVDNTLFESANRGQSWTTSDKLGLSVPIGNIGQILVDKTDTQVIYLTVIDASSLRGTLVIGF